MSNFIKDFYTVTSQKLAQDERLSWKARGIFLYLSSMSEGWNFYVDEIANHATDGKKSLQSGIKELEKYGYLKRIQSRSKSGTFGNFDWVLSGNPTVEPVSASTEKAVNGKNGQTENVPLINNNNNKEQLIIKNNSNKLGCYVTDFYEKNIGFLAPTLREDIEYEIEEWNQINPEESEKIIVEALKNAIGAQASNKWKYARSILNSWKEKNIKSLSDIEADDIEHRKKMELKYGKKKSYMRKPREEKMPYWFDDKNNNQVEKDQESKKETRAEINKLMEKINGDGSNG